MTFEYSNDFNLQNTCITFGNFDGLHAGHKKIFEILKQQEQNEHTSVMFRLVNHNNQRQAKCLTVEDDIRATLQESCPQIIISHPFISEVDCIEPEEFIAKILSERLGAKKIVVGENCRFGKGGRGDVQLLKEYAEQFEYEVIVVDNVCNNNDIITSDAIRNDLMCGNLERANQYLDNRYTLRGVVVHGKALGRGAKMPTANLQPHPSKLIPAHGVYATMTKVGKEQYLGMTNIGLRPTVDDSPHVTIETFLLDFDRDIYGKRIETELSLYVRETRKFNNLDEVRAQIDIDLEHVRKHFANK